MKRASSSAGQSCRLITDWSRVRTLPGPPPRRSKVRFAPALFVFYKKRHPPAPLLLLFPTKLCFANFCGGPAAPRGRQKSVISLATIFFKNHRALILLLHLGLSAAAYAAVGLETRLRAQSPPHKILLCKLLRGPCRPEGRLLKSSLCSGAFCFSQKRHPPAPLLLLFPTKLCFANFCGGPAAPRGRQKSVISLATIFFKNHRALILLLHLGLSAAAYAAVGLETRLRAQSPPHKILLCKLLRGPCRPEGAAIETLALLRRFCPRAEPRGH